MHSDQPGFISTYASEDKSRPLQSIPLPPLDVTSTGNIAIQNADSTHIHPHKTTSCVIDRTTEHHLMLCQGEKQKNGLTLTTSTPAQHLAVETGATTWIRDKANMCHVSSGEDAPPHIHCSPLPSGDLFPSQLPHFNAC
ncbi:hypothetical protein, partial [Sansalvadorimonas verongulae]|uniref:hypothetical protein n=1 Tax=Sansalvadorimonas verongulae TaxID=2172824 RepID=UPI001E5A7725